ncbi:hypothetical protein K432DRAFT_425251 [Lepidopterella palustris CBS 459.81]|uniref:Uncharacterized protein n=1 Tax=Lepidopterella palustris CBS 459.81 TaxID=1314670 RepID=A0A8E2JG14_9PEZI|nr:hypothetical protein K432DRAFT_425251 [Lepidopterella palustris CBS 459.81]
MSLHPKTRVSKRESVLIRALRSFPFVLLIAFAFNRMDAEEAIKEVDEVIHSGILTWSGGSLPIYDSFFGIQWLDNLWRPVTVIFAAWNLEIDPVMWWQMLTFVTDFGLIYSIMLIESTRTANRLTLARVATLVGLAAQLIGVGVVGPVYFFLHYVTSQIFNFEDPDQRLTNLAYTRTVFPVMVLSFYIPHFMSHFHPSFAARHDWDWIWQMFPVWCALIQWILAYTVMPNTAQNGRMNEPKRDLQIIRFTIGPSIILSAVTWLGVLTMSPFSVRTIFLPHFTAPQHGWMDIVRNFGQYDHLFCMGSAMLWLLYLFGDLKRAGMVQRSWMSILVAAAAATAVMGPGAAVGLGWFWRENVLAGMEGKSV